VGEGQEVSAMDGSKDHTTAFRGPLILVLGKEAVGICERAGLRHVKDATHERDILDGAGAVRPEVDWFGDYVILIPEGGENWRDIVAINLGDVRCRWAYWPENTEDLPSTVITAKPMWSDEVSTIDDVPDSGPVQTFKTGFDMLDEHGFRIVLPAFMPIIGPYGSGKSVFLRQLLVKLYKLHGWKFLLTSFEEKVKPRYERDLRRHFIGKPYVDANGRILWTDEDIARADAEIRKAAVFLRRKRNALLDMDRLTNRIEFAVRVHGIKVVAIDPMNEIDHRIPKGESKTDYLGKAIMELKALADDYNLLMIVCAHPPKDGVEKRMARDKVLTLNDGADTAHWGNKADIGLCVWRTLDGPTLLHGDKFKDHESMGRPFLAEMILNPAMNAFRINRMGYHILQEAKE
jgi:twinkle protein